MASGNGTRLKIDKSGRIVIPKRLRDHLGIYAEAELEVTPQSGGIFVHVVDEEPAMVKVDGLWVHRGNRTSGRRLGARNRGCSERANRFGIQTLVSASLL
jgi:AbrB family looped-hinge helix DNA binding protein